MPSSETLIQRALQAILRDLSLEGITPSNIVIRELPKVGERLDLDLPCILICPYEGFKQEGLGFESGVGRQYQEQVVIVDGSEGDNATDQDRRQLWHEQVAQAIDVDQETGFLRHTLLTTTVYHLEVDRAPTFDPEKLAANYVYLPVLVTVHSTD